MLKLNAPVVFGVFLLVITTNLVLANTGPDASVVVARTTDNMEHIRKVLICLTRSCNPCVVKRVYKLFESVETALKRKADGPPSSDARALKLAAVVAGALPLFLAIDPNCRDYSYTCPHNIRRKPKVPKEYFEMAKLLAVIVSAARLFSTEDAPTAMNIMGDAVAQIEDYVDTSGTAIRRLLPGIGIVATGFQRIWDSRIVDDCDGEDNQGLKPGPGSGPHLGSASKPKPGINQNTGSGQGLVFGPKPGSNQNTGSNPRPGPGPKPMPGSIQNSGSDPPQASGPDLKFGSIQNPESVAGPVFAPTPGSNQNAGSDNRIGRVLGKETLSI